MYVVVRCRESLLPQYLLYFLKSDIGLKHIIHRCVGAVRFQLRYIDLEQIEIPIPPLLEQKRIVRILDEAEELRQLRAEADRRATEFIPELFYDMFPLSGDASQHFREATIEQLVEQRAGSIRTGPFGSDLLHSEFTIQGVPVLAIDNVVANEFRWTEPRCIPEAKYQTFKRFQVFPGDVLVTIMGTVGRCAVAPEDLPVCISTKHLCVMSLDRTRLNPYYLWASILFDESVRHQTGIVGSGAIMEGWNSTIIRKLKIRLPSIEKQVAFSTRVAEVHCLKEKQAVSRKSHDDLFQSLLHRAFQGEP
jgi:type I restriction enzyme S subunit